MKQVYQLIIPLTVIGFTVGESQTSYVVVDSALRRKYQAQPGWQEWITVIECICSDGSSIPAMIIFKGKSLMTSWIPQTAPKDWYYAYNMKGWTNNEHGITWVKLFDAATAHKANGRKRLLLCDGHDSHISAELVRYSIDHDILILLLIPHSSHLMQPLDVAVFGPLKRAMSAQLDPIFRTGVRTVHKVEWMESYVEARKVAMTTSNILSGWRGAGLFPINKHRILHQLSDIQTTSNPPSTPCIARRQLLNTTSPPDHDTLKLANNIFNTELSQTTATSPVKTHARCLTEITVRLAAENAILKKDNCELRAQIRKQKERTKGKRVVLKDIHAICTEEIYNALVECERATKPKKTKERKQRSKYTKDISSSEEEEEDKAESDMEEGSVEIQDCIVVKPR